MSRVFNSAERILSENTFSGILYEFADFAEVEAAAAPFLAASIVSSAFFLLPPPPLLACFVPPED